MPDQDDDRSIGSTSGQHAGGSLHIGFRFRREAGASRLPRPHGPNFGKEATLKSNEGHPAVQDDEWRRLIPSASARVAVTSERAFLVGETGDAKVSPAVIAADALEKLRERRVVQAEGAAA